MATVSQLDPGPINAASREELRRVLGDVDDAKALEIIALSPTVAELEEALLWVEGEGDQLARTGHPLTGRAAMVYDILIRDEELPGGEER